ncbi:MAG: cation diffusion facilitator family transporter [Deltaproteobacteria bacterium]|nr:cation diffusion facilitator family transporter [Deltaproteobacteria bacterium]
MAGNSKKVVYAAMAGNGLIAASKFAAGIFTGSTAMISEAVHSVADTSNQGLLLFGMRRANRRPTKLHPLGYAPESYFWPFMVAIVIFLLGGVFAIYEGVHGFMAGQEGHTEHGDPMWNYIVLGAAIVFEGYVFMVALKEFWKLKGERKAVEVFLKTKDPTIPVVLMEDSAALLGLIIALAAVGLTQATGWYGWDALGSLSIGILLVAVSYLLARETHSLLLGESASLEVRQRIVDMVEADAEVEEVTQLISMHRGPEDVILALKIHFDRELGIGDVEGAINRIETAIRKEMPEMKRIFIEPDSHYDASKDEAGLAVARPQP